MAAVLFPLGPPAHVNGVKRKRSLNACESTSSHPEFATAPSSMNTTPCESDEDGFSESEGTISDDSDTSSEHSYAGPGKTKKASAVPILVNGQLISAQGSKIKKYKCTFDGCQRSYAKPARLEEHLRSHTGEVCL